MKIIKATEWEAIEKPIDVPTEIVGTTYSYYSYYGIVIGVLFVLSFSILAISIVKYLKAKDEQKKKKAKEVVQRFFIIFTTVFVLFIFWFMISLYGAPVLLE